MRNGFTRLAGVMLLLHVVSLSATADESAGTFELIVVGPDDQPIASASVEVRGRPKITAEDVLAGSFVKKNGYAATLSTDESGVLRVPLKCLPPKFECSIKAAGFAPFWARFDRQRNSDSFLASTTVSLDAAWTVGGTVVDSGGRPVVGAKVRPSVSMKLRPGDTSAIYSGLRYTTDENGRWSCPFVPVSTASVRVSIDHPDFQPWRSSLNRDEYEIISDADVSPSIALLSGFTLAGIITDENDQPIQDATVRTKFFNEIRETKTDSFGRYQLKGCEDRLTRVVVIAPGKALDMKQVLIGPTMQPTDFKLQPGGRLRVRVVDADGKGLPNTRIFFQGWRGRIDYFEFDHVHAYTNDDGVWEWNEAPTDTIVADICPKGGMQLTDQSIVAGEGENLFVGQPLLVISGRVLDAETGEPVSNFRVTPGLRNDDPTIGIDWVDRDKFQSTQADYQVTFNRTGNGHLVRIEATGYRVAQSREFASGEGDVTFDFKLQPDPGVNGQIVTSDGQPAANAEIAIGIPGAQIQIENGRMDDSSTYATRWTADDEGRFSIPSRDETFYVVIVHDDGHAFLSSDEIGENETVELNAWASVSGTYRVGDQPGANLPLRLDAPDFLKNSEAAGRIYAASETTTDSQGRFRIERVFSGRNRLSREIIMMVDDGATEITSAHNVPFEIWPGQEAELNIGGTGRDVIGQLNPPAGQANGDAAQPVLWKFATIIVRPLVVAPPVPVDRAALIAQPGQWEAWLQSDDGMRWRAGIEQYQRNREMSITYRASVAVDGTFRIHDVPPGRYELSAFLSGPQRMNLRDHTFEVDDAEGAFDLGDLVLER